MVKSKENSNEKVTPRRDAMTKRTKTTKNGGEAPILYIRHCKPKAWQSRTIRSVISSGVERSHFPKISPLLTVGRNDNYLCSSFSILCHPGLVCLWHGLIRDPVSIDSGSTLHFARNDKYPCNLCSSVPICGSDYARNDKYITFSFRLAACSVVATLRPPPSSSSLLQALDQ